MSWFLVTDVYTYFRIQVISLNKPVDTAEGIGLPARVT